MSLLVYDEIMVREPRLLTPRQQPLGKVKLNPAIASQFAALEVFYPHSMGKICANGSVLSGAAAYEVVDGLSGLGGFSTSTSWGGSLYKSFGSPGATGNVLLGGHFKIGALSGDTYALVLASSSTTYETILAASQNSGKWGIYINNVRASVAESLSSTICSLTVARLNGQLFLARDGRVIDGGANTTNVSQTLGYITIGKLGASAFGLPTNSCVALAYVGIPTSISREMIAELSQNPYQLLAPA